MTTTMKITAGIAGICSMELVVLIAAISTMMVPMLATTRLAKMKRAVRTPNFSRIRSARPRRLMRVRRIPISWVTPNSTVMMRSRNRMGYPSRAPAME